MKKGLLVKEAFFATTIILLIAFLLNLLQLKFEVGKLIKQDFADFDLYDLHYSDLHKSNPNTDRDIILIQAGPDRSAIARQLQKLGTLEPAVVAVDIFFDQRADTSGLQLQAAIDSLPSFVYSIGFELDSSTHELIMPPNEVPDRLIDSNAGYINLFGEEYAVQRYYAPFVKIRGKEYMALTSRIIQKYSPQAFETLKNRNKELEIINYQTNLDNYHHYTEKEFNDYYRKGQMNSIVKGKIVLLCVFSEDPVILEDLKFTPLNSVTAGKSYPDMYGGVIHANILTMILSGNYATLVPVWVSYLITYFVVFWLVLFILWLYKKNPHPAHWKLLLAQIGAITVLTFLFFLIFSLYKIKVQLPPIILTLVLAVELFGIYKFLAKRLHKKRKYETIFSHQEDH